MLLTGLLDGTGCLRLNECVMAEGIALSQHCTGLCTA